MTATPPSVSLRDASTALARLRALGTEAVRVTDPQARASKLLLQAADLVHAVRGTLMQGNTLDQSVLVGTQAPLDLPRDLLAEAMLERRAASRMLETGDWAVTLPLHVGSDPIGQIYLEAATAPDSLELELLETYAPFMAQLLYEANARKVLSKTRQAFEEKLEMALGLYDLYHAAVGEAMTDRLTGVGSRAYFDQRLSEQLDHARRYQHPLTLVLMDVDHFKSINDTYGHPAGDQVLAGVGALLRGSVRLSDVAARYGGEEFAVILPFTDAEGAWILADRLRQGIQEWTILVTEGVVRVTASFGLAELKPGMEAADLVQAADQALYRAKHAGRNQVQIAGREDA